MDSGSAVQYMKLWKSCPAATQGTMWSLSSDIWWFAGCMLGSQSFFNTLRRIHCWTTPQFQTVKMTFEASSDRISTCGNPMGSEAGLDKRVTRWPCNRSVGLRYWIFVKVIVLVKLWICALPKKGFLIYYYSRKLQNNIRDDSSKQ